MKLIFNKISRRDSDKAFNALEHLMKDTRLKALILTWSDREWLLRASLGLSNLSDKNSKHCITYLENQIFSQGGVSYTFEGISHLLHIPTSLTAEMKSFNIPSPYRSSLSKNGYFDRYLPKNINILKFHKLLLMTILCIMV